MFFLSSFGKRHLLYGKIYINFAAAVTVTCAIACQKQVIGVPRLARVPGVAHPCSREISYIFALPGTF